MCAVFSTCFQPQQIIDRAHMTSPTHAAKLDTVHEEVDSVLEAFHEEGFVPSETSTDVSPDRSQFTFSPQDGKKVTKQLLDLKP